MLLEARADRRAPPRRLARDLRRDLHNNQLATLSECLFADLANLNELCVRARVVCMVCVAAGGVRGLRRSCLRRAPTDALRLAASRATSAGT